jgi:glycosyltransferase involved in cell wall biosynthesis
MNPEFSIITCTLNSAHWLPQSIRSVTRQNNVSIEYIFVDGGSTDNTLKQIQSIRHPYILIQRAATGISDAMNAGISQATGKIVACLHSDDFYLHADVLSTVSKYFKSTGCRWLFGRTVSLIHGKLHPENFTPPEYSRKQLLKGNFIPHPATFISRELIQKSGGFNTDLRFAMDYDLWLRLSILAEPCQLNFPLTAFREHEGSLSTSNRLAAMREDLQVRLTYVEPNPYQRICHLARFYVRKYRQAHESSHKFFKHA